MIVIDHPVMQSEVLEIAREARSSIEVTRNARGDYQWAIKLYFDAEAGAEDVVMSQLRRVDADLRMLFIPKGDSE